MTQFQVLRVVPKSLWHIKNKPIDLQPNSFCSPINAYLLQGQSLSMQLCSDYPDLIAYSIFKACGCLTDCMADLVRPNLWSTVQHNVHSMYDINCQKMTSPILTSVALAKLEMLKNMHLWPNNSVTDCGKSPI